MLLHCMHDSVRAQRLGSWSWTALMIICQIADLGGLVQNRPAACEVAKAMALIQAIATVIVTWTHGMHFAHKGVLLALLGLRYLIETVLCVEEAPAVAFAPLALITCAIVMHMAELFLRHNYAKQYRLAEERRRLEEKTEKLEERLEQNSFTNKPLLEDKRRLEERNEQLKAEKERLFYDMQNVAARGGPLDNDDDRSVIRRGLQAGPRPSYHTVRTGSASSESGVSALSEPELTEAAYALEAGQKLTCTTSAVDPPWGSRASYWRGLPPPSLPPGPPSSTASSTAPSSATGRAWAGKTETAETAPNRKRVLAESACQHWPLEGLVCPTPSSALAAPPPPEPKAEQEQQAGWFATSVKRGRAALSPLIRQASVAPSPADGVERVDLVELATINDLPDEDVVTALQRVPNPVTSAATRPMPGYAIQRIAFAMEVAQQRVAPPQHGAYLPAASPHCMYLPAVSAVGALPSLTLQEKFHMHVMCNYTPKHPSELPKLDWVSCN